MAKKQAETELRKLARGLNYGSRKYGDVRQTVCLYCKSIISTCPRCHKPLLQPKSENAPDYSVWPIYTWVECKESGADGRWGWTEISENGARANQRRFLIENGGWLFLLLGNGRVSKDRDKSGRSAYLIPFKSWLEEIEPALEEHEMKSIKKEEMRGGKPAGDDLLAKWRLDWGSDGWEIPKGHIWWYALKKRAMSLLEEIEERI